jgi:hypothetical protein
MYVSRLNAENKATNAQEGPKLMTVALDQVCFTCMKRAFVHDNQ